MKEGEIKEEGVEVLGKWPEGSGAKGTLEGNLKGNEISGG